MLLVGYGTCINATKSPECTTETNPEGAPPLPPRTEKERHETNRGGGCRAGRALLRRGAARGVRALPRPTWQGPPPTPPARATPAAAAGP